MRRSATSCEQRVDPAELLAEEDKTDSGLRVFVGKAENQPVELLIDRDGLIKRGKCLCGHHKTAGLRRGPCRHLLALRQLGMAGDVAENLTTPDWYTRLLQWANN